MNTEMFLSSLLVSDANSLGIIDIFLALCLPFLLSIPATMVYRRVQASQSYGAAFIHAFFLFSSLSSILTLIIGNNIARAFGLIGALSIIRFRNALKSPLDAVYIFWALSIGMACGTGFYLAAIMITLVVSSMALLLSWTKYGERREIDSILRVNVCDTKESTVIPEVEHSFAQQALSYDRLNVIFDSESKHKTYVYRLAARDGTTLGKIEKQVQDLSGVSKVQSLGNVPSAFAG